jgi:hypothetical protein
LSFFVLVSLSSSDQLCGNWLDRTLVALADIFANNAIRHFGWLQNELSVDPSWVAASHAPTFPARDISLGAPSRGVSVVVGRQEDAPRVVEPLALDQKHC